MRAQVRQLVYASGASTATAGRLGINRLIKTDARCAFGYRNPASQRLCARCAFGYRNPASQRLCARCATTRRARGHLSTRTSGRHGQLR